MIGSIILALFTSFLLPEICVGVIGERGSENRGENGWKSERGFGFGG